MVEDLKKDSQDETESRKYHWVYNKVAIGP